MEKNRNYLVAIALSVVIVLAWQFLYMNPRLEARRAQEAELAAKTQAQTTTTAPAASTPATPGATSIPSSPTPLLPMSRDEAVARTARVEIDTPSITGSVNLTGARLDDIRLKDYRETVDKTSPIITLFSPSDTHDGYFAELGFVKSDNSGTVPGPSTVWEVAEGSKLTPATPVTLRFVNEKGVTFTRKLEVDDHYLFTVTDRIENAGTEAVTLSSYGRITRYNKPTTPSIYVLHEGFLGVIGADGSFVEEKYKDIEETPFVNPKATGGWVGITDKYWASALVPPQKTAYDSRFSHFTDGQSRYQADYRGDEVSVAPGQPVELQSRVFAGAKEVPIVDSYRSQYEIPRFDLMIDWGWFYFITKPMFKMMDFFYRYIGNFGLAILLTTVVVKLLFFPLASKQYASMANMKRVQPKLEELKAKFGDDRMGLQQAMMEVYKTEKINPLAGCWPLALQIPVFFALYKVIYVTIEMRHAPFFGWIQDLSAPDPTSFINLFGLLPFAAPTFLHLGVWPIIMGITMFVQMRMNPTPPDPTQAMIFNWMPLVFTFMLASFPAGLVIYWAWNNTLSVTQQALIMKKHGAKIELFDNIKGLFRRKGSAASKK
ncbi:membrane protein insertase YidC [Allorhizobium borbori]|uniref:Membrane protein insertase YidC n=1 Tax=Allorhizobium borbori TaxID=485907 RepID=A0A7W6NZB6_9HYPH|nr:membrane protein insertase YidC [Allorhizobium borbori]MBB4101572.1 YidC/Oxa1 family membrane protein insertase [Allorhizobium borbori]PZU21869.1 MAG: membrane protein insertase YidC [Shinella sp.]